MSGKNKEGYKDPTAEEAIRRASRFRLGREKQCSKCENQDSDEYRMVCMVLHPKPKIINGKCKSFKAIP